MPSPHARLCPECRAPIDKAGAYTPPKAFEDAPAALLREAADTIEVLLSLDPQMPTAENDVKEAEALLKRLRDKLGE